MAVIKNEVKFSLTSKEREYLKYKGIKNFERENMSEYNLNPVEAHKERQKFVQDILACTFEGPLEGWPGRIAAILKTSVSSDVRFSANIDFSGPPNQIALYIVSIIIGTIYEEPFKKAIADKIIEGQDKE